MSIEARYSIFIDPDTLAAGSAAAVSYVVSVHNVLVNVERSRVGKTLLRNVASYGNTLRIAPSDELVTSGAHLAEQKDLDINKHVIPVLKMISPAKLKPFRGVIRFNPKFCAKGGSCQKKFSERNSFIPTPESVLVHELLHTNLQLSKRPTGTLPQLGAGWGNGEGEEFLAVLVEDIFRSETKTNLRAHHNNWNDLDGEFADSFAFFKVSAKVFELVDRFCRDEPKLTRELSCVRSAFNPIAAFFRNRARAKAMSNSQETAFRDKGLLGIVAWEVAKRLK
jgi:hypothetical protein